MSERCFIQDVVVLFQDRCVKGRPCKEIYYLLNLLRVYYDSKIDVRKPTLPLMKPSSYLKLTERKKEKEQSFNPTRNAAPKQRRTNATKRIKKKTAPC